MTDLNETSSDRRRRGLRATGARAGAGARAVISVLRLAIPVVRLARDALWRLFEALLAVVIVFEEWGWRPLAALLAALARFASVARLERFVAGLSPYPAMAVFALPGLMLLPLKLLALAWIAEGHVLWATLLFVGAKVGGTALVARIFQLTQPALMQLGWFVALHDTVMPWKHAMVDKVRASRTWRLGRVLKFRGKHAVHAARERLRPLVEPYVARIKGLMRRG